MGRLSPKMILPMNIIYRNDLFYTAMISYESLLTGTPWVNRDAPRDECFMASEDLSYTYGKGFERTYKSVPITDDVKYIMDGINYEYQSKYNVCFLNYYKDEKQHLGWHSDDSKEMDIEHPIAVVSYGAEREIWVKHKDFKGVIPQSDRYKLGSASLFIMPAGYQKDHLHKIPKPDKPCGGRISLTFRRFIA